MILIICMLQKHFAILEQFIEFYSLLLEKEFLGKSAGRGKRLLLTKNLSPGWNGAQRPAFAG
ncbi:MAG: hypothetical protein Q4P83_03525 [Spirochaetales bacterium]|nr:hypothetical protein [Spirochaetales bacterium]